MDPMTQNWETVAKDLQTRLDKYERIIEDLQTRIEELEEQSEINGGDLDYLIDQMEEEEDIITTPLNPPPIEP
jgi:predicted transcriptional regulator